MFSFSLIPFAFPFVFFILPFRFFVLVIQRQTQGMLTHEASNRLN